jgi:iron complex outermembrane receptor protein
MLDGRRMAGSPSLGASTININMIPMAAVERMDIMADGGSAVYGSDAVAGVVNMQMRRNYEGIELKVNYGQRDRDDGTEEGFAVIAGVGNDSGNITVVMEYTKREPIWDRDRPYTAARATDSNGNGIIDAYVDTDGYSIYGNSIWIYDPTTGYDNIQAGTRCQSDGPWLGETDSTLDWFPSVDKSTYCMYGYANASANKAGLDKISTYVSVDYDMGDKVEFFATGLFSMVDSFGRYAPPAAAWPNMPEDYVDVPFDIPALLASEDITLDAMGEPNYSIKGYYRWTNIGTRDNKIKDTQYDFTAGFRGDVNDSVSYEIYAQRSRYDVKDIGYYYLSYPGLDYVLNQGIDPFSEEGAGAMSSVTLQDNFSTLSKIYGHVQMDAGDWFGAGEVVALVGAEVFDMEYENLYDRASEFGFVGGSAGNSSGGDRDVTAVFGEAIVPITADIDINAAIRYDDYSDFGSEVSPSLSAVYRVVDSLSLRARWSQGFRAPALDELYGPETFSAEDATDYYACGQVGISTDDCNERQVETYFSTNPDLGPETSQTFSIGGSWDISENWNVDAGYWIVEIEDLISQSSTQSVLYAEAAGVSMPQGSDTYVDRDAGLPVVYASYSNAGELNVEGIDLKIRGSIPTDNFGEFFINLMWSHQLQYEQTPYFKGKVQETKGFNLQPEDRAQIMLGYTYSDHHLDIGLDYIGDYSQSDFIAFSGQSAFLDTSDKNLDDLLTVNLAYTYDSASFGRIKIGARNVTDEDPVLDRNGKFARDSYELYDPTGRLYYAEYSYKF